MASHGEEISDFSLLQPELLDKTALKQILDIRCVKLQNMSSMSKEQLVEIFYRVAVPLPQRVYKDNRRGKLLTKMRKKRERSINRAESIEKNSITYGFNEASTSRSHGLHLLGSGDRLKPPPDATSRGQGHHSPRTGDRLKPPPDAINFERKKIRLNSSSSPSVDLETVRMKRLKKFDKSDLNGDILDRIVIKDRRKEKEREEKTETQNTKQKVTDDNGISKLKDQSKTHGHESHSSSKKSGSQKIKLKRSHSISGSENPHSSTTSDKDSEVKKHKKRIMWP